MDKQYWDEKAERFEDEIFNVFTNDKKKVICSQIRKYGSKRKRAIDFGAGTGRFLGVLSKAFQSVLAVDLSGDCLEQAQKQYARSKNITYRAADLARPLRLEKGHFGLSVNTSIMASRSVRKGIFKTVHRNLLPKAFFLMVVPSWESVLLTDCRRIQWNLRDGLNPMEATLCGFSKRHHGDPLSVREGIIELEGVPTKHYLREELEVELDSFGFDVKRFDKVEYEWSTEFAEPPRWMKKPYPWDWLVTAKRR